MHENETMSYWFFSAMKILLYSIHDLNKTHEFYPLSGMETLHMLHSALL